MGFLRCGIVLVLGALMASGFLLPAAICLLGMKLGADAGARCGLFGGFLCLLEGFVPGTLILYTTLGAAAGGFFHRACGFWGKWLRTVPLLAGFAAINGLLHWWGQGALVTLVPLMAEDLVLALVGFPLAYGLVWLAFFERKRRLE